MSSWLAIDYYRNLFLAKSWLDLIVVLVYAIVAAAKTSAVYSALCPPMWDEVLCRRWVLDKSSWIFWAVLAGLLAQAYAWVAIYQEKSVPKRVARSYKWYGVHLYANVIWLVTSIQLHLDFVIPLHGVEILSDLYALWVTRKTHARVKDGVFAVPMSPSEISNSEKMTSVRN